MPKNKNTVIINENDFNNKFYLDVPINDTNKVLPDDFFIPKISEYELIAKNNYKVGQLKRICKFYNRRTTGKKHELSYSLYNYLYLSSKAVKIQKMVRGFLRRKLNKSHGPGFYDRGSCTNLTDFFTLEDLKTLDHEQFYSYKDSDGFIYGFNILSLYNLIDKGNPINPYNRNPFPKNFIPTMRNHIRLSRVLGINIEIDIKEEVDEITPLKRFELRTLSLFQTIDSLGNYSDSNWLLSLNHQQLKLYLKELHDIWNYRAQLSQETKMLICPPTGDPFRGTDNQTVGRMSTFSLKKLTVSIMENLVNSGSEQSSKALGAFYVLSALTLVNSDAATALPWLYQSVAHLINL